MYAYVVCTQLILKDCNVRPKQATHPDPPSRERDLKDSLVLRQQQTRSKQTADFLFDWK